jgi:hypothetical protein
MCSLSLLALSELFERELADISAMDSTKGAFPVDKNVQGDVRNE